MADYSQLQSDLVDLLHDTEVDTAKAQEFIARAEPKLDRDLLDTANGGSVPQQKILPIEDTLSIDGTYVLPSDFHRARTVRVSGNIMRYASPEKVNIGQDGYSEATINLVYYQRIPVLSATNTSNWLLDVGYDAYLYGAALQWISWGQDTDNLTLWTTYYRDAIRTVKSTYGARPRGSFRRQNGRYYGGFYTIMSNKMFFARAS